MEQQTNIVLSLNVLMHYGGNMREKLKLLLDEYTIEEILELSDVEPLDALEYMVTYSIIDLEWSDGKTEEQG